MPKLPKCEIKRLKRAKKLENKIIIGVDPASLNHTAVIYSPDRQPLSKAITIKNMLEGFENFEKTIKKHQINYNNIPVIFAIEASGERWKPMWNYFNNRGYQFVFVSPLFVKRTRDLDDYTPRSSDPKDAVRICNLALEGRYFTQPQQLECFHELAQYVKSWEQVSKELARTRQRIRSFLEKHFPEYFSVISNILGAASLEMLGRWPFPQDLLAADRTEILKLASDASQKKIEREKIDELLSIANKSVGITIGAKGARKRLRILVKSAKFFKEQAADLIKDIRQNLKEIGYAERIRNIPGICFVSSARLLGHLGDLNNFDKLDAIIDFAGLSLIYSDSGNFSSRRHISRRGRKALRRILYEITTRFIRFPNTARRKYLRCRLQGKGYRQSVTAAIPHMVRAIFSVVKGNENYQHPAENAPIRQEIAELEARWAKYQKQEKLK